MFDRFLQTQLRASMADTPVIFLAGARQTGKSTLVQGFQASCQESRYTTFDDLTSLAGARRDPVGFVEDLPGTAFLDEVQRVPELFLPIKASVDRNRRPGRFILTGSANIMVLPKVADSLTGRMEILTLWPLAQGEILGTHPGFIDACFRSDPSSLAPQPMDRRDILAASCRGGFPEAFQRPTADERSRWFDGYLTTLVQRDLRELSEIQGIQEIPRLLTALAIRAGSTLNLSDLTRDLAVSLMTVKRYLALFQALYLLVVLPPWFENLGQRLVKAPKIYFNDSGLLSHLLGIGDDGLEAAPHAAGPVLETFVAMELMKTASLSRLRPTLHHFRTGAGAEVDFVLENRRRELVGIEVKASSTVQVADFKGLQVLRGLVGDRLKAGVVLYTGGETVPFGEGLWAVPVSALWSPAI